MSQPLPFPESHPALQSAIQVSLWIPGNYVTMNRRELLKRFAALPTFQALQSNAVRAALPDFRPATHPIPALVDFERLQFGVSFHFSMNTFTGNDYDTGTAPAATYNPTRLDVRQWIRVASELGARYAVLTAKHMSGFCLWDSRDY